MRNRSRFRGVELTRSVCSGHRLRLWAASTVVENVEGRGKRRGSTCVGELHCVCTGSVLRQGRQRRVQACAGLGHSKRTRKHHALLPTMEILFTATLPATRIKASDMPSHVPEAFLSKSRHCSKGESCERAGNDGRRPFRRSSTHLSTLVSGG